MIDPYVFAIGGIQSRQGTHHIDVGKTDRAFFLCEFQLHPCPIVRKLIAKQIYGVVGGAIHQQVPTFNPQICRLPKINLHASLNNEFSVCRHAQRIVHQIGRVAIQTRQNQNAVDLSINRHIVLGPYRKARRQQQNKHQQTFYLRVRSHRSKVIAQTQTEIPIAQLHIHREATAIGRTRHLPIAHLGDNLKMVACLETHA